MWAHRLIAPGQLEAVEVDEPGEPGPGRVVARFEAGGICGSDIPSFLGVRDLLVGASQGKPGYPGLATKLRAAAFCGIDSVRASHVRTASRWRAISSPITSCT